MLDLLQDAAQSAGLVQLKKLSEKFGTSPDHILGRSYTDASTERLANLVLTVFYAGEWTSCHCLPSDPSKDCSFRQDLSIFQSVLTHIGDEKLAIVYTNTLCMLKLSERPKLFWLFVLAWEEKMEIFLERLLLKNEGNILGLIKASAELTTQTAPTCALPKEVWEHVLRGLA